MDLSSLDWLAFSKQLIQILLEKLINIVDLGFVLKLLVKIILLVINIVDLGSVLKLLVTLALLHLLGLIHDRVILLLVAVTNWLIHTCSSLKLPLPLDVMIFL